MKILDILVAKLPPQWGNICACYLKFVLVVFGSAVSWPSYAEQIYYYCDAGGGFVKTNDGPEMLYIYTRVFSLNDSRANYKTYNDLSSDFVEYVRMNGLPFSFIPMCWDFKSYQEAQNKLDMKVAKNKQMNNVMYPILNWDPEIGSDVSQYGIDQNISHFLPEESLPIIRERQKKYKQTH